MIQELAAFVVKLWINSEVKTKKGNVMCQILVFILFNTQKLLCPSLVDISYQAADSRTFSSARDSKHGEWLTCCKDVLMFRTRTKRD
jgi:hypothetical protein